MTTTEWNAAAYHQINSLQQWLAEESLGHLALRGDERALDVGSGDGRVTAELAEKLAAGQVLGVDPSERMVAYARQAYGHGNLRFEVGDARALPFRGQFDLLVSFNALHWVPRADWSGTLECLRRALEPGGRAHLRFVGRGPRKALEVVAQETARDHAAPFTHWTLDELYALAEQHGFRVESMELLDRRWDFPPGGFRSWAETTFVPWTGNLPPEEQAAFIEAVLGRYASLVGRPDRFAFYQLVSELTSIAG